MCSRREVTISTKPVTSQRDRHLPLLGLRTCIHFQNVHVRQKGRKQKPLKKIPLPGEIPALKEAELGLLPKVIPTVTGNQSGQTTGHGHRLLTRKLFLSSTTNLKPKNMTAESHKETEETTPMF